MAGMNKVILVGSLANNIKSGGGEGKIPFVKFTVAIPYRKKNRTTDKYETDMSFVPCTAFGSTANYITQYCSPKDKITVEGKVQQSKRTVDGKDIYSLDIIADRVNVISSANWSNDHTNYGNDNTESDTAFSADDFPPQEKLYDLDIGF